MTYIYLHMHMYTCICAYICAHVFANAHGLCSNVGMQSIFD